MRRVLKITLAILTLAMLVIGCLPNPTETAIAKVGQTAPDFELRDLNGQLISLKDFRGQPVLINFWATWCYYCITEMPYLQQVYQEWSGKGLVMLTINLGEDSVAVKDFMQKNNLSFPVLLDTNEEVGNKYGARYIPATFFIDKEGVLQDIKTGSFRDKEEIEDQIERLALMD